MNGPFLHFVLGVYVKLKALSESDPESVAAVVFNTPAFHYLVLSLVLFASIFTSLGLHLSQATFIGILGLLVHASLHRAPSELKIKFN